MDLSTTKWTRARLIAASVVLAGDAFVTRLDPSRPAAQQLLYSTFVGGAGYDDARGLTVDSAGIITVAGSAAPFYPTTPGAFVQAAGDCGVTRLDPSRPAAQQLLYSTHFGGSGRNEVATAVSVDAAGVISVIGVTSEPDFPTTPNAWDTTYNGGNFDVFVTRLDPSRSGSQQLLYSTFLGGSLDDWIYAATVDAAGVVTVAGATASRDYPVSLGAWDSTPNGSIDAFVTRLDPLRPSSQQLLYSTLVGGAADEFARGLAVDSAGVVTIAGETQSANYPTTPGAFDSTHNGRRDAVVTRLDMLPTGVSAYGRSSPGCTGSLAISVTSMPRIGNASFALTCSNAPPNATGGLAIGARGLNTPLVVSGASIFIDPTAPLLVVPTRSNAVGASNFGLPLPNNPWLVTQMLYAQFLWVGPSSPPPCPVLGVSASNALAITIQR